MNINQLINQAKTNDFKSIARLLTLVENELAGFEEVMKTILPDKNTPIIGITGSPGAGKSTLVNALVGHLGTGNKKIAILAVDPTSPFNFGSLLGDRIRMNKQFNNPNVFIRSVATRGALGGISAKAMEMTEILKASNFDFIFIETVGVGQSEVEVAGLADLTLLVLVPEGGDEVQHLKSGIMEIADAFIVNKADRPGAAAFANNLLKLMKDQHQQKHVFQTTADKAIGIDAIVKWINTTHEPNNERKMFFLAEKLYKIIQSKKMNNIKIEVLLPMITNAYQLPTFSLYGLAEDFIKGNTGA